VPAAIAVSTGATSPSSTREPEGERKQLTVLFADVQGSMELQEDLDVEAWAKIVDRFVNILADGVRRFGGTGTRCWCPQCRSQISSPARAGSSPDGSRRWSTLTAAGPRRSLAGFAAFSSRVSLGLARPA
jgi:class 3 adenylate cyclase